MKIALIGYGKMGKAIEKVLKQRGHRGVARFNRKGIDDKELANADVAIEFSRPEAVVPNLASCFELKVPVVCGTTGWLAQFNEVSELCRRNDGAFLYASNFSLGVNLFFEINKRLAQIMNPHPKYEVSVHEIHHIEKLDAPSGTAISLAEQAVEELAHKDGWTMNEQHAANQIHISADRIANTPGTHVVNYYSDIDSIEIKHTAHSRSGFALGAVMAAEFINGKKGIFTMKDVLNL